MNYEEREEKRIERLKQLRLKMIGFEISDLQRQIDFLELEQDFLNSSLYQ